jgi:hypothetical protein
MRVLLRFLREWSYVFVGAAHGRDCSFGRGPLRQAQDRHGPVTILHLLQQIADCLLLVLLQSGIVLCINIVDTCFVCP